MDHVAIMTKRWKLIPKILSGEKTIESRWYQTRRTPWDRVRTGDVIYFKNSGELIIAKATVSEVMQFEIKTKSDVQIILQKYGKKVGIKDLGWLDTLPKYCVLVGLESPKLLKTQFSIDKTGFGSAAAWLTMKSIARIKTR
jgi:ASC-1-like (ASCH) protein